MNDLAAPVFPGCFPGPSLKGVLKRALIGKSQEQGNLANGSLRMLQIRD